MIKNIIFDLDNTLLFISNEWEKVYQEFIDKYNLHITPKDLYDSIDEFEKNSNGVVTIKNMADFISKYLNINITEEMIMTYLSLYKDIPFNNTDMVYDILDYLSKKYKLIIYTNWYTDNQMSILRKYNLDKFINKIYGWDILPIKPSSEGIKSIVGNDDIKEYIMIGDNIKTDLEVPFSLGMNTIFYNRKNIEQDTYREIKSLEKLKDIL